MAKKKTAQDFLMTAARPSTTLIERLELVDLVTEQYFSKGATIRDIVNLCNTALTERGDKKQISSNHVYSFIKQFREIMAREADPELSQQIEVLSNAIGKLRESVEKFYERLTKAMEEDDILTAAEVHNMYHQDLKLLLAIQGKLPPPAITIETLQINIMNCLQIIKDVDYLPGNLKRQLIEDISRRVNLFETGQVVKQIADATQQVMDGKSNNSEVGTGTTSIL